MTALGIIGMWCWLVNINYAQELIGIASWYGNKFKGKKTYNGERFNPEAMTMACKSLPMGSVVEVTNLKNGKKAIVRVNDKGPWVGKRKFDVSRAVAKKLVFCKGGLTKVKVRVLATKR